MLDIAAICLVITALFAYLNHKYLGLPSTIGLMAMGLCISLLLVGVDAVGISHELRQYEASFLRSIDFSDVLMQGMLSFLLFAGALHIDLRALRQYRWQVAALALVGTLLSTLLVGIAMWFVLPWIGLPLPLLYCLLFGALISPTDPIAVMGCLRSAGAPKALELVIAGESLFNDGVGVVIFTLFAGMLVSGAVPTATQAGLLLLREAGGGILLGVVCGLVVVRMLKSIDQYQVEVLLTLALVMGGYSLARKLEVSGPLAMVVCGLIIGNGGRTLAMSDNTRRYVDLFWELIDEVLNAVLFLLIGLEVVLVAFSNRLLLAGACAIAVTLAARWLTVGWPVGNSQRLFKLPHGSARVLTWGGLRGGISVALGLSLPASAEREIVLSLTYCVVAFSILVQGLSIRRVISSTVLAAQSDT